MGLFGPDPRPTDSGGTPLSHGYYTTAGVQAGVNQAAPQLATQYEQQLRGQQMQQIGQLQGIASGQQQGAGEIAVQRQVADALARQQAFARMQHGGQAGLGYRAAARNAGTIGIQGAGQAQQAALGDQMAAQGLLGQVTGQARGQDIGVAGQNATLQSQQNALAQQYLQSLMQQDLGAYQGTIQQRIAEMNKQSPAGAFLAAGGQIGAGLAMSDERVKTDIADSGEDIDAMLDALVAKRYRYKNEERHGRGERSGIMAQDLLKSRAGAAVVRQHADGLALDINAALSASLAANARLNARLRKVEKAA